MVSRHTPQYLRDDEEIRAGDLHHRHTHTKFFTQPDPKAHAAEEERVSEAYFRDHFDMFMIDPLHRPSEHLYE